MFRPLLTIPGGVRDAELVFVDCWSLRFRRQPNVERGLFMREAGRFGKHVGFCPVWR